jgi:hypothetical protein
VKRTRFILLICSTLVISWTISWGQDGSDILYGKISQLDNSYIGDFVHLDFYRLSRYDRNIDTVDIIIDSIKMKFVERRSDNGFNNWFNDQYLESVDKPEGVTIRVVKARLDKITKNSIFVTNYLEYYRDNQIIPDRSKQVTSEFPRNIIVQVLVSAESHAR